MMSIPFFFSRSIEIVSLLCFGSRFFQPSDTSVFHESSPHRLPASISCVPALFFFIVFALSLISLTNAYGAQVTLAWEAGEGPAPAGYEVFFREEGQSYDFGDPAWEGTGTSCTIFDLDEDTGHYFVVRAFDGTGTQSENSNEVYYAPLVDVDAVVLVDQTEGELTTKDLMESALKDITGDDTASIQSDADGILTLSAPRLGDLVVPGKVHSVVASSLPDGIDVTGTGQLVFIKRKIAITMGPVLGDLQKFEEFMKAKKLNHHISPNTGMISLLDSSNQVLWRGMPSYILEAPVRGPEGIDGGIAFEDAGDVNNDGLLDLYIITRKGRQVIYTLP
jgi:hypothetical protein